MSTKASPFFKVCSRSPYICGLGDGLGVGYDDLGLGYEDVESGYKNLGLGYEGLVLGLGYEDVGLGVPGFGIRVRGCGIRIRGFGIRVRGFGFRVRGFGIRVRGFATQRMYINGLVWKRPPWALLAYARSFFFSHTPKEGRRIYIYIYVHSGPWRGHLEVPWGPMRVFLGHPGPISISRCSGLCFFVLPLAFS